MPADRAKLETDISKLMSDFLTAGGTREEVQTTLEQLTEENDEAIEEEEDSKSGDEEEDEE